MKNEYPIDDFKNHILTVIHEHEKVKRYQFKQPETGCYGFNLTCADNLMVMTGDCYTLIIEPGYGRCGLAFLRGAIHSTSYFLEKCAFRGYLTEYKKDYALEDMKEFLKEYYEDDDDDHNWQDKYDEFVDGLEYEDGEYGRGKYYDLCSNLEIEDPPAATRMTPTTKMQIAGLMTFVKAYDKHLEDENRIETEVEVKLNA